MKSAKVSRTTKGFIATAAFALFLVSTTLHAETAPARTFDPGRHASEYIQMYKDKDFLGLRIMGRLSLKNPPKNYTQWYLLRRIYQQSPQVGHDMIAAWDKVGPEEIKSRQLFEALMSRGSDSMMARRFEAAFKDYQSVAVAFLEESRKSPVWLRHNLDFYNFVKQSAARSLYGAGRYEDALKVYDSIDAGFFNYKRVIFEKMWTAFMAGRVELALGMVASLRSAYFSNYIDPEVYMIQVYAYKKLCRNKDLERTLAEMRDFKRQIDTKPTFDLLSLGDLEIVSLKQLLEKRYLGFSSRIVTRRMREEEQARISKTLDRIVEMRARRFSRELDKIIAYAQLAAVGKGLASIEKLPDRGSLLKKNLEIWPADSSEVWLDEVGYHRFIGESQCASSK
jgi:hypothetical protein